ncbi:MAG: ester cyclase [Acidobacteriota bacterium]|nr:ester cyclase [Acidobacteriota bacterium]
MQSDSTKSEKAEQLALEFFRRVWTPPHNLAAVDELMTPDYKITSGGKLIEGREAFKNWIKEFQTRLLEARTENIEVFANATGDRVVSRWVCTGFNNGFLGFAADKKFISFTGIAIWRIEDGRLAECWVERSAWELYQELSAQNSYSSN